MCVCTYVFWDCPHIIAILLRDAMYGLSPAPLLDAIHHTTLAMAILRKGQTPPPLLRLQGADASSRWGVEEAPGPQAEGAGPLLSLRQPSGLNPDDPEEPLDIVSAPSIVASPPEPPGAKRPSSLGRVPPALSRVGLLARKGNEAGGNVPISGGPGTSSGGPGTSSGTPGLVSGGDGGAAAGSPTREAGGLGATRFPRMPWGEKRGAGIEPGIEGSEAEAGLRERSRMNKLIDSTTPLVRTVFRRSRCRHTLSDFTYCCQLERRAPHRTNTSANCGPVVEGPSWLSTKQESSPERLIYLYLYDIQQLTSLRVLFFCTRVRTPYPTVYGCISMLRCWSSLRYSTV